MIAAQSLAGTVSAQQAQRLRHVLDRIQGASVDDAQRDWHPGRFVKRFPTAEDAPALARAALVATAVGIPRPVYDSAELLVSELVTNSVKHSASDWVEVTIALDADRLRIEVFDAGDQAIRPRPARDGSGWGLALVAQLATSWGVSRQQVGKSMWIEFDLSHVAPSAPD